VPTSWVPCSTRSTTSTGSWPRAGTDTTALTAGVSAVIEKTQRVLAGLGVERVDAAGVPFDPTVHDAVQQIELDRSADAPDGSVTPGGPVVHQVLRPGYRMPDRVLRAAMVVVAQ
jgi:molecular chaperone GrpE